MKVSKPVRGKPNNPFPVTAKDEPQLIDPATEPTREEANRMAPDLRTQAGTIAFMERTRRYYRLTHRSHQMQYARGLDSKPEDFA